MDNLNLVESFAEFAKQKNIDRPTMMKIMEDVFRTMIRKKFGNDENFDIIVNTDKGDLEIWRFREIVSLDFAEDSFDYDENKHIALPDARKI
ncbi:MAG: transcription elongation factor, partial [Bacteroidota bacterium]